MKKRYLTTSIVAATLLLGMFSCENVVDYNKGYDPGTKSTGPPTVNVVTNIARTDTITSGDMDQIILIEGSNLSGVTSLKFNDVTVDLTTAYDKKAAEIAVPIPRILPGTVNNLITIKTPLGETTYPFTVTVPKLIIWDMYNEFALPGDTTDVVGQNFDLYDLTPELADAELAGVKLKILKSSPTSLTVIIPKSAADNSILTVKSDKMAAPYKIPYRDQKEMCFNYSDLSGNHVWAGTDYISQGSLPTDKNLTNGPVPCNGPFTWIKQNYGAWSWNNLICGDFQMTNDDIRNHPENYDLKFEINTNKNNPIPGGNFYFQVFDTSGGTRNYWDPTTITGGTSFNTNSGWNTVTMDLNTYFNTDKMQPGPTQIMYINLQPSSSYLSDFSMCNFRIVKKVSLMQ